MFLHENGFAIRARTFGEQGHLSFTWRSADGVGKVPLRGLRFAPNFPDASVGQVVGLFPERSYKCGAEPLNPIVRLSGEVSVVERDQVRAFVSAVAGFFGILVAVPIQGEQILTASQARSLVCTRTR